MRYVAAFLASVLVWATTCPGQATAPAGAGVSPAGSATPEARLGARLIASHTAVRPGDSFHVAVALDIAEGWVFYSPSPLNNGGRVKLSPPELTVKAPGLEAGEALWPADKRHESDLGDGTQINYAYEGRAVLYLPVRVPAAAAPGERTIEVALSGQSCSASQCSFPETGPMQVTVTVAPVSAANPAWTGDLGAGISAAVTAAKLPALHTTPPATGATAVRDDAVGLSAWAGLSLALLAGLILNIMPCVLPVIPLHVLSLVQLAGESRRRLVVLGLAFAAGTVLFFVALAGVNIVFRLAWQSSFSVGGLFQLGTFRIGMALVLVALAANLFGLYNVTVPRRIAALERAPSAHGGFLSSVGMGLMMAVLATPCSFAILAQAVAWAQVVSLPLGTAAIVLIGVGMAAPHALMVAFPKTLKRLPRPGQWMELFKQSMGFLLLPVAVWLIFAGSEDSYPLWVIDFAILLAACLWIWGTWVRYDAKLLRKLLVRGPAVALTVAGGLWMLAPAKPLAVTFEPFDEAVIEKANAAGRTVLLKFTSDTCTSCRVIDYKVFNDPTVAKELAARNVLVMKADTTNRSSPAAVMSRERYGGAVPVTVILPPAGGKVVTLEGLYTGAALIQAIDQRK